MAKTETRGGIWDDRKARRASVAYAMINTTGYICMHRISVLSNRKMHRKIGETQHLRKSCAACAWLAAAGRQLSARTLLGGEHKRRQVTRMRCRPGEVLETSYRSLLFASAVGLPVRPPGCCCLQKGIRWIDSAFPGLDTGCCAFPRSPKLRSRSALRNAIDWLQPCLDCHWGTLRQAPGVRSTPTQATAILTVCLGCLWGPKRTIRGIAKAPISPFPSLFKGLTSSSTSACLTAKGGGYEPAPL